MSFEPAQSVSFVHTSFIKQFSKQEACNNQHNFVWWCKTKSGENDFSIEVQILFSNNVFSYIQTILRFSYIKISFNFLNLYNLIVI